MPWLRRLAQTALGRSGLICGGFVTAFAAGSFAVYVLRPPDSDPVAQASSGMYAFGDSVLFLAVFGSIALVPTGFMLWTLRTRTMFWTVLAIAAWLSALSGALSVGLYAFGSRLDTRSALGMAAAFSVLRLLVSPLMAAGLVLCALICPRGQTRRSIAAASALEACVTATVITGFAYLLARG